MAGGFSRLSRDARAWLEAPTEDAFAALSDKARAATSRVPETRRADWERLLAGFGKDEPVDRRRARVEGLVRACALFTPPKAPSVLKTAPKKGGGKPADGAPLRWEDPVNLLPGFGPNARTQLAEQGITCIADLVWTLPAAWDDLRAPCTVAEAIANAEATRSTLAPEAAGAVGPRVCVRATVKTAGIVPMRGRRAVRVVFGDETGKPLFHAWWFFEAHGVLATAKKGAVCLVVGRMRIPPARPAFMAHPEVFLDVPEMRTVRPRYPKLGPPETLFRKAIHAALARLDTIPDPVPADVVAREEMLPAGPLVRHVHGVDGAATGPIEPRAAFERLAWVEAFARVWERTRTEAEQRGLRAPALPRDPSVRARLVAELGFPPTRAQTRAMNDVAADLAKDEPMRRLLLGDVGTGKTAVALAALAQCVAAGHQAAVLVPTSILAEQYLDATAPLARSTGASVVLLTAGVPAAQRRRAAEQAAAGNIDVLIGTHALLGETISFARLGLVVVDEQHRLGVAQRLALVGKGERPHLLTLSATPIPRTLALALRGELATSTLDERPRGRPPVTTEIVPRARFDKVVESLRDACARGERAFFVAPYIEDDEDGGDDVGGPTGVEARAADLARRLAPARVLLVHGGLSAEVKRRVMREFRRGPEGESSGAVLVGTTVVEVGVDVPEATLMVVDGAEHFGMAQLHQLRGRVGRGDKPGRCLLVHDIPLSPAAEQRLAALSLHTDGATLAKIDLELRGAGELGGTRQSGAEQGLLYLDPGAPPAWLDRVEDDARAIVEADPTLTRPEHRALALQMRRFAGSLAVREEAG